MDLFLSCIDHPWADQRSLEIDEDYFDKEAGDRRWEDLKTLQHAFQKHFAVLNEKDEAKAQLAELVQVYGKMDDCIKKFKEIAPKTKINDVVMKCHFSPLLFLS